jgi:glucokinase
VIMVESLSQSVIIGVDVGGTKVLAGVVDSDAAIRRMAHRSTPDRRVQPGLVEQAIADAVGEAAAGSQIAAVGVAAAGLVDRVGERVLFAPHLPWQGEEVRERLESLIGVPVILDNDANAAAWAEFRYGAANGTNSAIIVTMGTGIGGAVVMGWLVSLDICRWCQPDTLVSVVGEVVGSSTPLAMPWSVSLGTTSAPLQPSLKSFVLANLKR